MGFLKSQLARLQAYVNGLNASQKMLSGSLLTIMLMTLLWLGRYAGTPEMEPLLSQDLSAEELGRIKASLTAKGIPVQVDGSRLMVPADRKFEIIADLSYGELMPSKMDTGFDDIIAKLDSPMNPADKNDQMWKRIKEQTLDRIIGHFPRVRTAKVMLDGTRRHGFGSADVVPSASVYIEMKSREKPDRKLVEAAAELIAGATAGMDKFNVHVAVDGVPCDLKDGDFSPGGGLLGKIKEAEKHYADNIREALAIEGAMVAVRVTTDNKTHRSEILKYDKENVVSQPLHTESQSKESRSDVRTASAPGDVGTGPNVAVDVRSAGSGGAGGESTTTTDSNEKADNQVAVGRRNETIEDPGGQPTVEGATVRVPRSYFVRIWQNTHPNQSEPTEAVLRPIMDKELGDIKHAVRALTGVVDEKQLLVADYTDITPLAMSSPQAASTPVSMLLGGHFKEMALGAMALVSLFLVMMVVKKGAVVAPDSALLAAAAAAANESTGPRHLGEDDDDLAGEVGEGNQTMDGIELDPESARSQQVVDQVSALVKDNPDAAATLVQRWLNRA